MSQMTLAEISEKIGAIDFGMLSTRAASGEIASRPMSNNGDVEYKGDSYFFALETTHTVQDIERDPKVGLTFTGAKGLFGKPPLFIAIEGHAELIRDKAEFQAHWVKDLDNWFEAGIETPGLTLIKVRSQRIHYWDGYDQGEIVT